LTVSEESYHARVDELRRYALSDQYEALHKTGTTFRIALIDGMPDLSHECFSNAPIEVDSSLVDEIDAESLIHGTAVASTLAGFNDKSLGLCCHSMLICLPVLDHKLLANMLGLKIIDQRLATAVRLAVKYEVDIIQMSLEFNADFGKCFKQFITAIQLAARKNIRTVMATGNTGTFGYNKVLAVSGVVPVATAGERRDSYAATNLGADVGLRGFSAPGNHIPVAVPGNQYRYAGGSSYAASFLTAGYLFTRQIFNASPECSWNAIYESHLPGRRPSIVPPKFNLEHVHDFLMKRKIKTI